VLRWDHHCIFVVRVPWRLLAASPSAAADVSTPPCEQGNCIGARNFRFFIIFLAATATLQALGVLHGAQADALLPRAQQCVLSDCVSSLGLQR
jgi:hypothetical protein